VQRLERNAGLRISIDARETPPRAGFFMLGLVAPPCSGDVRLKDSEHLASPYLQADIFIETHPVAIRGKRLLLTDAAIPF